MLSNSNKDLSRLIRQPLIRDASELAYHKAGAPGTRWVFVDKTLFPQADIYQIVRTVSNLTEPPPYVEEHKHVVNSTFVFVGSNPDLTGLEAEVILDKERFEIQSPATVFIPGGLKHSYRLLHGSGLFIHTLCAGSYEDSLV